MKTTSLISDTRYVVSEACEYDDAKIDRVYNAIKTEYRRYKRGGGSDNIYRWLKNATYSHELRYMRGLDSFIERDLLMAFHQ